MKYILDKSSFKKELLITEDSGPLENNISWGDSLVGRLLFSLFRLVQVGVDKGKISYQLSRLEKVLNNPIYSKLKEEEGFKNGVKEIQDGAAQDTLVDTMENNPED